MIGDNGSGQFRKRFVRSFLDWVMLSILYRKPSYGYEMISYLRDEYGVFISAGSLYPILYNLERAGLVHGEWNQPDRKSRKVYRLTEAGGWAYREGLDSLGRVLASMEKRPGPDLP